MMFKGPKNLKPGEFSKKVAAVGGRDNALTGKDYTAYFQQIEKSHLPAMMALEADRMQNLRIDKEEFAKEIQVVLEERRLTQTEPVQMSRKQAHLKLHQSSINRHGTPRWIVTLSHRSCRARCMGRCSRAVLRSHRM
jgi:zinc protease